MSTDTAYKKELREKIMLTALREFKAKGIRQVKMDDVAQLLSISKRTIYELFADKEELLLEGAKLQSSQNESRMKALAERPGVTVMDIIIDFYHWQTENLSRINPAFFEDMARYKKVLNYIDAARRKDEKRTMEFFSRGVKEGYFRNDVDFEIVTRVGNAAMKRVMEMKMYQDYELNHLFRNIMFLFLRGFCTAKGLQVIDSKLQL